VPYFPGGVVFATLPTQSFAISLIQLGDIKPRIHTMHICSDEEKLAFHQHNGISDSPDRWCDASEPESGHRAGIGGMDVPESKARKLYRLFSTTLDVRRDARRNQPDLRSALVAPTVGRPSQSSIETRRRSCETPFRISAHRKRRRRPLAGTAAIINLTVGLMRVAATRVCNASSVATAAA